MALGKTQSMLGPNIYNSITNNFVRTSKQLLNTVAPISYFSRTPAQLEQTLKTIEFKQTSINKPN